MAERSFEREVQDLRLQAGEIFRGEGILAITKALLQSGVSYVAGYQGAPISHLMDVLADAKDVMEASASISKPQPRKPPPPRRSRLPSCILFAARLPSNRPRAPMSRPTRSRTWRQAASPAAR